MNQTELTKRHGFAAQSHEDFAKVFPSQFCRGIGAP